MHLFFESVWKLHIGEIPEKPKSKEYLKNMSEAIEKTNEWMVYVEAIAAIKQNALTVGNPEIITTDEVPGEPGKPYKPGEFYFWPGGADILEKIPPVAVLTLPEEKKNTMENNEEGYCIKEHCTPHELGCNYEGEPNYKNCKHYRASGSAENMAKEQELTEAEKFLIKKSHEYPPFTHGGLNQLPYLFVSAVAKCMEEFVQFSLYKDHPTTSSGSVAAPKEERTCPKCGSGKIIMFNSDDDLCQTCGATFPGVLNGSLELASLRQQLKEREEALKELLPIAERYEPIPEYPNDKAIIERVRKLISK